MEYVVCKGKFLEKYHYFLNVMKSAIYTFLIEGKGNG